MATGFSQHSAPTQQHLQPAKNNARKAANKRNKAGAKYAQALADRQAEAWAQAESDALMLDAEYRHEMMAAIEKASAEEQPLQNVIVIERTIADKIYKLL